MFFATLQPEREQLVNLHYMQISIFRSKKVKVPHRSSTVPTLYCDGTQSELLAYCERTMSEPRANHERYGTVDDTCTQYLPVEEDSY